MIVKPAINWLTKDSDTMLLNDTNVVLLGMGDNVAIYPTPSPNLLAIAEAMGDFQSAVAAAADGGPSATSNKNNKRFILVGYLRQLASYVGVACQGDMTKLLLSGFPIQKPVRTPVGMLPAPQGLIVTHGMLTGTLNAKVNPVFGAATYNWMWTANTPNAVPVTGQSTAASFIITGLTPGVTYTVMCNAVGAAGPSNWSQSAPIMAI
jgi:hypothetical protein